MYLSLVWTAVHCSGAGAMSDCMRTYWSSAQQTDILLCTFKHLALWWAHILHFTFDVIS